MDSYEKNIVRRELEEVEDKELFIQLLRETIKKRPLN